METFIFGWCWRAFQFLARENSRIFQILYMPWKNEWKPTIKLCMGRKTDVVPEFTTAQNFGHNQWWTNGIRVEYFYKIHHIAALQQSPKVTVESEHRARRFHERIIFKSMFNDISWWCQDNEQECELSVNLVSISARRFSPRKWSFLGLGSEKKWYSTHDSKSQGEWDKVAELMMIKFSESGHPVFRSTNPLSRGTLKSKWDGKLRIHFFADDGTIETVLRLITSVHQSITERSQICVKNRKSAM